MHRLFAAGVLIVLAGFVLILAGTAGQGGTSAGGVIFIGPIPIVFGSGPSGWPLALASLLIGGLTVFLLLFWGLRVRRVQS